MKAKITQALVERAPTVERGRTVLYADPELRGFYLIVSNTKRSYYTQSLVRGRQVRTKIGEHPALAAKDARALAAKTLVAMRAGVNPTEERRKARARGMTLQQALDLHIAAKKLSAKTVEGYRYNCGQYLSDWLDTPLAELGADRAGVRERHARITKRNGGTTADAVFRIFRAVYNRGLREHPDLPANPAMNVDFHGQKRRKVDVETDRLKAWGMAVLGLSPIRRDLNLFMMLSGMRRTAACESKMEHISEEGNALHVPSPKGGAARAFDLPLSFALTDLVAHRAAANAAINRRSPWLFPSDSKSGHVAEVQQSELEGLTGHALRHAYASLALQAGVPLLELKFLLNHSASSGGVTMGYLHPSLDHLREHQEKASIYILDALGLVHEPGSWPPRLKE